VRIVSLLPSATEIVCRLGLREQLVGVTHECDYPPSVLSLPKVTRTLIPKDATSREIDDLVRERLKTQRALYSLDLPTLERLAPDLIVTQALCDVCAVAEEEVNAAACSLPGRPMVINLEPARLEEVFDCMLLVGRHVGREQRARDEVERLKSRVAAVAERSRQSRLSLRESRGEQGDECSSSWNGGEQVTRQGDASASGDRRRDERRPRVMLLEWIDPPFSAGHWNPQLVRLAGGEEVIGVEGEKSRTVAWSEIVAAAPEVMMISCCGFDIERTLADLPILRAQPGFGDLSCVKSERVYVADGSQYFSRPGPRLVDSLEILAHAIDPEVHPEPLEAPPAIRLSSADLHCEIPTRVS
jgi:iron complex transport system substrate-binding protein